jgi:general secretion pathway protein G
VTFVELLVVATGAGVAATIAIPTGLVVRRAWQERQLKRSLATIRAAIDAYHLDWEKGCIESEDEKGWPEDLEELLSEKELADDPECTGEPAAPPGEDDDEEPHDTSGWKARSYEDEPDATSWKDEGVYDVYSSSSLTALDGSKYEEW